MGCRSFSSFLFVCCCVAANLAAQDLIFEVPLFSEDEQWLKQRQFLEENGYLWIKDFFSPEQAELLQHWAGDINTASREVLETIQTIGKSSFAQEVSSALIVVPESADPFQVCRAEDMLSCYPELHHFVEETITFHIGRLMREPYVPFKDKINFKWPGGGAFSPHQDFPAYDPFGPREHVTAMVCIDRATLENGCLQVAKNWRATFEGTEGIDPELLAEGRVILPYIEGGKEHGSIEPQYAEKISWQALETSPRDLVIFNSFLPHYSEPNHSAASRRAMFFTYNKLQEGDHRQSYYYAKRHDPDNPVFHIGTPTKARGK